MDIVHTGNMLTWTLKETMDENNVTRYALQKRTDISMNTIRSMYDGGTQRPDLNLLDRIIHALREMTGQPITLTDVLSFTPQKEE